MSLAYYGKSRQRRGWLFIAALVAVAFAVLGGTVAQYAQDASALSGAIYTTDGSGAIVNQNIYPSKSSVYLNGGPTGNCQNAGLDPDGDYYFQVTSPSGVLLSTDAVNFRQIKVVAGKVAGVSGAGNHPTGAPSTCGSLGVQLLPYSDTPNPGGEYKVAIFEKSCVDGKATAAQLAQANPPLNLDALPNPPLNLDALPNPPCAQKSDNFKVVEATRTIHIGKVVWPDGDGSDHNGGTFSGTITPVAANATAWSVTLAANQDFTDNTQTQDLVVSTDAQVIAETGMPSGWTNVAIYYAPNDVSCQNAWTVPSAFIQGNTVPAGTGEYTVCIKNHPPETPQDRQITVTKVRLGNGPAAETFGGSIAGAGAIDTTWSIATGAGNNSTSQARTVAINAVATIAETLTAAQTTAGWSQVGISQESGLNATCPPAFGVADSTVPADTASYTYCVYNLYTPPTRTIYVCKYVVDNGALPNNEGATFSFSSNPAGSPASVSNTTSEGAVSGTEGIACEAMTVPDQSVTISETPLAGWTELKTFSFSGVGLTAQNAAANCTDDAVADTNGVLTQQSTGIVFCNKAIVTTRTLTICKYVVDNGALPADEGGQFSFTTSPSGTPATVNITRVENQAGVSLNCATAVVPVGDVTVTESALAAGFTSFDSTWPKAATFQGIGLATANAQAICAEAETAVNSSIQLTGNQSVLFCNKAVLTDKTIEIVKHFYAPEGYTPSAADLPTFTLNPSAGTSCGAAVIANGIATITCTVPGDWTGTVTEIPATGWTEVFDRACFLELVADQLMELVPFVDQAAAQTFTFCNELDTGTVLVHKVRDGSPDVPAADGTQFSGAINGDLNRNWGSIGFDATSTLNDVVPGAYGLTENLPGSGWTLVGYAVGDRDGNLIICPTVPAAYTATSFTVVAGQSIVVCVMNTKNPQVVQGSLTIRKVITNATDTATNFSGTVTGQAAFTTLRTNNQVQRTITITNGEPVDLTVAENDPSALGYTRLGYKVFNNNEDSCGATPDNLNASVDLTFDSQNLVQMVCVYNQRNTGTVIVEKVRDNSAGVPAADGTTFSGAINGPANRNWGPVGFAANTTLSDVLTGAYSINETGLGNGWTPVGAALAADGVCPTAKASYGGLNFNVTSGATIKVCVMNTKQPQVVSGLLTIHKVVVGAADASTNFSGSVSGGISGTFNNLRTNNDVTYNVTITGDATVNVTVGETNPAGLGYTRLGYRLATNTAACSAGANLTAATVGVSFDKNTLIRVVCVYNQRVEVPTPFVPVVIVSAPPSTPALPTNTPSAAGTVAPAQTVGPVVVNTPVPTRTSEAVGSDRPAPTPRPPSTGGGTGSAGGSPWLFAGAVLMAVVGAGAFVAGHRRRPGRR
jgi:hypothetical protein